MPSKPSELPPKVAKTFVKHMRAFYAERSAIKRDKIAGHAAHLLALHQKVRTFYLRGVRGDWLFTREQPETTKGYAAQALLFEECGKRYAPQSH